MPDPTPAPIPRKGPGRQLCASRRFPRAGGQPRPLSPITLRLVDEMVDEFLADGEANDSFSHAAARTIGTRTAVVDLALCELVRRYRAAYVGLRIGVLNSVDVCERERRLGAA